MPNWKKIIQSGSNAELASITSSGNIIPSVDNVHSIGTSDNRFLLNGGTPVTVTGSGTTNTLTRFQSSTTVEDSRIFSSDTLTRVTHGNANNDIFIISGSNGEMLSVTDQVGDDILRVNNNSGINLFSVSSSGNLTAPQLTFNANAPFTLGYESGSGLVTYRSSSNAVSASYATTASHALNTTEIPAGTVSGSVQTVANLLNQDVDLGTGDLTATTASVDYVLVNNELKGNGAGFQFFAFNEDTVKVKFANWYSSNDRQYGQGQLWYEQFFAAVDNTDLSGNRRIGFYLEQPNSGSTDSESGITGAHPSNSRMHIDKGGVYMSGSVEITNALTASGLRYPTTDGSANQVMSTDGSGNLSFNDISSLDVPSFLVFGQESTLTGQTTAYQMKTTNGAQATGWRMPVGGKVSHITLQLEVKSGGSAGRNIEAELYKNNTATGQKITVACSSNGITGNDGSITEQSFVAGDRLTLYIKHNNGSLATGDHAGVIRILTSTA